MKNLKQAVILAKQSKYRDFMEHDRDELKALEKEYAEISIRLEEIEHKYKLIKSTQNVWAEDYEKLNREYEKYEVLDKKLKELGK